jgi:hypothetical protein
MSEDPNQPPQQPLVYTSRPGGDWGTALVFACLAIGFCMSWGTYEMHGRLSETNQARAFRHDLDIVVSRQSDLGWLLSDPRTKLIRLAPVGDHSPVRAASVAWNESMQRGAIFCNDLASNGLRRYQVQLIPASGAGTAISFGPALPGETIYSLIPAPADVSVAPAEIVLSEWTGGLAGAPLARGTVREQD